MRKYWIWAISSKTLKSEWEAIQDFWRTFPKILLASAIKAKDYWEQRVNGMNEQSKKDSRNDWEELNRSDENKVRLLSLPLKADPNKRVCW